MNKTQSYRYTVLTAFAYLSQELLWEVYVYYSLCPTVTKALRVDDRRKLVDIKKSTGKYGKKLLHENDLLRFFADMTLDGATFM